MTIEEAWAIGLFEGEGSICLHPTRCNVRLSVTQSDPDVLARLQQVFGGTIGFKTYRKKPAHYKPTWQWRLGNSKQVIPLLLKMLPLLGDRRAYVALNALDKLDRI